MLFYHSFHTLNIDLPNGNPNEKTSTIIHILIRMENQVLLNQNGKPGSGNHKALEENQVLEIIKPWKKTRFWNSN